MKKNKTGPEPVQQQHIVDILTAAAQLGGEKQWVKISDLATAMYGNRYWESVNKVTSLIWLLRHRKGYRIDSQVNRQYGETTYRIRLKSAAPTRP